MDYVTNQEKGKPHQKGEKKWFLAAVDCWMQNSTIKNLMQLQHNSKQPQGMEGDVGKDSGSEFFCLFENLHFGLNFITSGLKL